MRIAAPVLMAAFGLSLAPNLAPVAALAQAMPGANANLAQAGSASGGGSEPLSNNASNINPSGNTTGPQFAPRLPAPPVGPDAPYTAFLKAARTALVSNRTGEAQEALERAQTRLLDRSVPLGATNDPSKDPRVAQISAALQALGNNNRAGALQMVDQLLQQDAKQTN